MSGRSGNHRVIRGRNQKRMNSEVKRRFKQMKALKDNRENRKNPLIGVRKSQRKNSGEEQGGMTNDLRKGILEREKPETSFRGRGARTVVGLVNHLPGIGPLSQNGELRMRLSKMEKEWVCPKGLTRIVIDMQEFSMEMLMSMTVSGQDASEIGSKSRSLEEMMVTSSGDSDQESVENKELLSEDKESSVENKQFFSENKESLSEDKEVPVDNEQFFSENKESFPEDKESLPENTKSFSENDESVSDNSGNKQHKRLIIQLHGGGYYGRLHNTYRDMAAIYHEVGAGCDVLSVDYRVAPKDPYPAALEDAYAAYQWALRFGYEARNIIVAGDSAGGGLTLALVLKLKDDGAPLPAGIITMSAWTDLTKSGASYEEKYHDDPVFGDSRETLVYKEGYIAAHDPHNPYISPIFGDFTGFPPMLMQVGEREMLLSDTLTVAKKAKEQGVMVKEHTYAGMFHDFQMGFLLYRESKEAWEEVGRFIHRIWGKDSIVRKEESEIQDTITNVEEEESGS